MRRIAFFLALLPGLALAEINYTVAPEPEAKSIRVQISLEAANDSTEFRIPAWCPGYYVIQNYHSKISDVKAADQQGKSLVISKGGDRAWKVAAPKGTRISFSYRVLGDDPGLGFFGVSVKPHTAFINGPAAFMYVEGRLVEGVTVRFDQPSDWGVATAMDQVSDTLWSAGDYDELADHPIQLGKFERRKFTVEGYPFEAIFVSENQAYRANLDRESEELKVLSRPAIKMMRGAPFKKYVYLIHLAIGDFSGGLEHRASTVIAVPNRARLNLDELATHEFFHTWNVKHIRPKALGPFDYTQKVREPSLWFSEGVTDYYAHLHAYQAGIRDAESMIRMLGDQIAELQESRTRKLKTLEDAGLEAWEHGSMGTGDLSYYTKGSVAGLVFDAAIRSASDGRNSLDDAMRSLYAKHRLPKQGYEYEGILEAINEAAGTDLRAVYKQIVQSTQEMPYELLSKIGLRLRMPGDAAASLGYRLEDGVVAEVDYELTQQGLRKGDKVLQVDRRAFGPGCYAPLAKSSTYRMSILREGKSVTLTLRTRQIKTSAPTLEFDPFADERAEKLRDGWLKMPA